MPARPTVTVAVLAEHRRAVRSFLGAIAGELDARDNAVLLRRDGTGDAAAWRTFPAGEVRTPVSVGELRDVVVVVDPRTSGRPGWISSLVTCLATSALGAIAPTTNIADGDELLVGAPFRPYDALAYRRFLDALDPSTPARPVEYLDGPCLALSSARLERLGGLARLCRPTFTCGELAGDLVAAGSPVGVAPGVYLHHEGGASIRPLVERARPFISACMIVKDEADNLPRSLPTLRPLVDEIVIYDTGSSDDTREIATACGATVIEGYWDGDFSRARNAALEHCQGQWIVCVDADEAVHCDDPQALRAQLRTAPSEIEGFLVTIDNLRGTDAATVLSHPAVRLFRRAAACWGGRIHEQVFARAGVRDLALATIDALRLEHWGYVQAALSGRDKAQRNLKTAFGDLAGGSDLDLAQRLTSLGRSYLMAGRIDEGLETIERAIDLPIQPATERLARRALVEGLLAAARFDDALAAATALEEMTVVATLARALKGQALVALERFDEALACFDAIEAGRDDDGFEYEADFVATWKAQALAASDRPGAAADTLLETLRSHAGLDAHLGLILECLEHAGRPLAEIVEAIPPERVRAFVPQAIQLQPEPADRLLDAWHAHLPASGPVLAAAAHVALRLDLSRQLVWSARLRSAGFASSCPLVRSAADESNDATYRLLAAATAHASFGDPSASLAATSAGLALDDAAREQVANALASLDPSLAAQVRALPRTAARSHDRATAPSGRRVLVVATEVAQLRAEVIALSAAKAGHHVSYLEPAAERGAAVLLEPAGVTVARYDDRLRLDEAILAGVARVYTTEPIDAVVLGADAAALADRVAKLVPAASIVVDAAPDVATGASNGLILDVAPCHVTARDALALSARRGVALVADARAIPQRARSLVELVPSLASLGTPLVVLGDDPSRSLANACTSALVVGPCPDPGDWLRSVRLVVVAEGPSAATWIATAAACGTPSIVVGSTDAGDAARAAATLVHDDDAWARAVKALEGSGGRTPVVLPKPATAAGAVHERVVELVGSVSGHDSLSHVNRELALRLGAQRSFELRVSMPHAPGTASVRRAAVEIRHQWPPDFTPTPGKLVLIQPWEFGGLPAEWIGPLRDVVDELWVPSAWVRDCAVASGVDAAKVVVVPNGVDASVYRPDGQRFGLRTRKSVKFLFVGGLIERKGVDALLETYLSTFDATDDVCLVIKPFGSNGVYATSTLEDTVRRVAAADGPEIEIVDDDLDEAMVAALYRSCDVLVHPYRGEGFGLPVAEAMASGLPVIVTSGGACDDFCREDNAWLVESRTVPITPSEWTPSKAGSWWLEPSRPSLAGALRAAAGDAGARRAKGEAGRLLITTEFTWERAAKIATERLERLSGTETRGLAVVGA